VTASVMIDHRFPGKEQNKMVNWHLNTFAAVLKYCKDSEYRTGKFGGVIETNIGRHVDATCPRDLSHCSNNFSE